MSTKAQIGQAVQVDLAGLKVPGFAVGEGVLGRGEIVKLDPESGKVTVKLTDLTFGGDKVSYIEAPVGQVAVIKTRPDVAGPGAVQIESRDITPD